MSPARKNQTRMPSQQQHEYRHHVRAFHIRHPNLKGVELFKAAATAWRDKKEQEKKKHSTAVQRERGGQRYRARIKRSLSPEERLANLQLQLDRARAENSQLTQDIALERAIIRHQEEERQEKRRRRKKTTTKGFMKLFLNDCAICLEALEKKEACLVCKGGHAMHCDCIERWDAETDEDGEKRDCKCPFCKEPCFKVKRT